jgi:hypothetical protein
MERFYRSSSNDSIGSSLILTKKNPSRLLLNGPKLSLLENDKDLNTLDNSLKYGREDIEKDICTVYKEGDR